MAALATGCVIPIPTEPDQVPDAAPINNADPIIVEAQPPFPGNITIFAVTDPRQATPVTVTVGDADIGDTIYVRVFRDYQLDSTQGYVSNDQVPGGTRVRGPKAISTVHWCDTAQLNVQVTFDVVIADRPFDDNPSTPPAFQAVTQGGNKNTYSWLGKCVEPL